MSYRPKIRPEQMERLRFIRKCTGIPISMLVDDALRAYVQRFMGWLRSDGKKLAARHAETTKEVTL